MEPESECICKREATTKLTLVMRRSLGDLGGLSHSPSSKSYDRDFLEHAHTPRSDATPDLPPPPTSGRGRDAENGWRS